MGAPIQFSLNEISKEYFSDAVLRLLYDEKISESQTVGKDGVTQNSFNSKLDDEISIIVRKVLSASYKFTAYREKLISKGAGKTPRVVSIPTIRDRLTLRALNNILTKEFPEARSSLPHIYIKNIKRALEETDGELAFVRIDVREFFPTINHKILIRKIRQRVHDNNVVALIESAISTPTGNNKIADKGVPQGLSISNILSSIYLKKLDKKLDDKLTYFRYVDDILVICLADVAESVFEEIRKSLRGLHLTCHKLGVQGKSQINPVDNGIDYLGFHIKPGNVSVRPSSFTHMMENLLAVLTSYKHAEQNKKNEDRLIWRLNLKVTGCIYEGTRFGWMFFFSQVDDLGQLSRLDKFVTAELNRRNLGHIRSKIKRFTRAFHEIRSNFENTHYIPKFDDLSIEDMISVLSQAYGRPILEFSSMGEAEIRRRFSRLAKSETRSLEKDLIEAIS